MNIERIKEILEELDGIALKKIHYITNMNEQKIIIKDGINDPNFLKASVRVYARNNYDFMQRIEELTQREMDLYSELLELAKEESQA